MLLLFALLEHTARSINVFRNERVGNRLCFFASPLLQQWPSIACVLSHQWGRCNRTHFKKAARHKQYVCVPPIPPLAGQLVSERTSGGTYYYLTDDLGSVLKVVDSSGSIKNSYYYDPYGNSLNKSETVGNPWQYASGYFDANTGLYKFGTRYYDPQLGRWTQKDPIGSSVGKIGSDNPYVYAGNVPNMQVDPSGRATLRGLVGSCLAGAAGAAVVTIIGLALGIITAPESLPIGLFIFVTTFIACIGGQITYAIADAIGS